MRRNPLRLFVVLFATLAASIAIGTGASGGHHSTAGIMPPVTVPIV